MWATRALCRWCVPILLLTLGASAAPGQPPASSVADGRPPPRQTHHIDRLPQPAAPARAEIDLQALARGYEAAGVGQPARLPGPRLLLFVSLAMPEGALRRLIADGGRVGAILLMRGLEAGSLRKTTERVRKLGGARSGAIQIDPQAFVRFGVGHVPVFVLAQHDGGPDACREAGCTAPDGFVSVAGDVTVDYALRHVAANAPAFAAHARQLLRKLER